MVNGIPESVQRDRESPSRFDKIRDRIARSCLGHSLVGDGFSFALRVGFFSGLVANLIDLDHLPMFWGGKGRMLHPPLCFLALCVALYCSARIGGLLIGVVLENRRLKRLFPTLPPRRRHVSDK